MGRSGGQGEPAISGVAPFVGRKASRGLPTVSGCPHVGWRLYEWMAAGGPIMTDARQRRRERAQTRRQVDIAGNLKKYRVPIVIAVVWALVVAYNVAASQGIVDFGGEDCPGHWHSNSEFFVDGVRVQFAQPPYNFANDRNPGKMPMSNHWHSGDDRKWHWEPPRTDCMDFRDAAKIIDVSLGSDSVSFDGSQSITGSFANNETHSWKVFSEKAEEPWQNTSLSSVGGRQHQDGERVVFVYGPIDDDGTAMRDRAGPAPRAGGGGNNDGAFIAITMTTIFAGLATVIWYNFAKKTW